MNELRKAVIAAFGKYDHLRPDVEVSNFDDEESFVEKVDGGFWVEARVWVSDEEIE